MIADVFVVYCSKNALLMELQVIGVSLESDARMHWSIVFTNTLTHLSYTLYYKVVTNNLMFSQRFSSYHVYGSKQKHKFLLKAFMNEAVSLTLYFRFQKEFLSRLAFLFDNISVVVGKLVHLTYSKVSVVKSRNFQNRVYLM